MHNDTQTVRVQNLTDNPVVYLIPEDNLRRVYRPYEEKTITVEELRKVFYQPGGPALLREFLQVKNKDLAIEFGVDSEVFEHEYSWDKAKVENVLLKEDIDILHDALDFAPEGIIDLIVDCAIELRIADINKRELISEYTGKDINRMITIQKELDEALGDTDSQQVAPKRRRAASTTDVSEEDSETDGSLFTKRRRVQ